MMDTIEYSLKQLDDVCDHRWESISSVLAGVTEDEAHWQPPGYDDVPPEAGWPPPGTIRWHVAHLAHCKRHYALTLELRRAADPPSWGPRVALDAWTSELEALQTVHLALRASVAALALGELELTLPNGDTVAAFLGMVLRHEAWHGGQIAFARRLYRRLAATDPST